MEIFHIKLSSMEIINHLYTVKFIMSNYIQIELFLIISASRYCSHLSLI